MKILVFHAVTFLLPVYYDFHRIYINLSKAIAQSGLEKFCQETAYPFFSFFYSIWQNITLNAVSCEQWLNYFLWSVCVYVYSSDSFTVCMESITAFVEGPLAFLATYAFVKQTRYRYVAQLVLSLGQFYGDVLYFSIEMHDGFIHGPVGHPLYFWFYFMFLNSLWIVIPFACIVESWKNIAASQSVADVTDSDKGKRYTSAHKDR